MIKQNKILACVLSFSLLGQSALFAAPSPNSSASPQTLADYQARAKEELKNTPWLDQEGKDILSAGGAVATAFVLREVSPKNIEQEIQRIKSETERVKREIENTKRHPQTVDERVTELEKATAQVEKGTQTKSKLIETFEPRRAADVKSYEQELKALEARRTSLSRFAKESQKSLSPNEIIEAREQLKALELIEQKEAALLKELAELNQRNEIMQERYAFLTSFESTAWKNLDSYAKIFDPSVPALERKAWRERLANEPWLKQAPLAQQKEFMQIVDQAASETIASGKRSGGRLMEVLIRQFAGEQSPLYRRLINLCKGAFRSKNVLAVGLVFALGMAAQTASAQKMADRVNQNFDLFLNATPQELAEMEKDKEVVKVCVQGAEVLHQMGQMTQEEQDILSQAWRAGGVQKASRASQAQLAR